MAELVWQQRVGEPFEVLGEQTLPVVVHVPHSGLHVPDGVRAGLLLDDDALATELRAITDHRTDVLAAGAIALGACAFVNRLSRLVVDPERFPDPGEEEMEAAGMGAVYTRTTDARPLRELAVTERAELIASFFTPYASRLTELVGETLERHGQCVIVDLHSYPARRLDYERGGDDRPPLCVGVDAQSTPQWLAEAVEQTAARHGIAAARNSPFAGTYVPRAHMADPRVSSVMLEVRRDLYLDEATAFALPTRSGDPWVTPTDGEGRLTAFVTDVVATVGAAR